MGAHGYIMGTRKVKDTLIKFVFVRDCFAQKMDGANQEPPGIPDPAVVFHIMSFFRFRYASLQTFRCRS